MNETVTDAPQPEFLKSLVTPLDSRAEMSKLGKMCSCFSYGS